MNRERHTASPSTAATNTAAESIAELQERLALIEARLQQLFEHLDIAPRGGEGELDPNEEPEIQDLLAKGNEAQAIKRYHEITGVSLGEAKQAIERAQSD